MLSVIFVMSCDDMFGGGNNDDGGGGGGGGYCIIIFDNTSTYYYIKCYVNDTYVKTVNMYSTLTVYDVPSGSVKLYGIDTTSSIQWGPKYFDVSTGSTFTWTLLY